MPLDHQAAVIATKKDADGAISVLLRCCGDASTESWHTFYVQSSTSEAEVRTWLLGVMQRVQDLHLAHDKASAILREGL